VIFVGTWAWLALAYARDPYHAAAAQQHQLFRQQRRRYVTSDFVLTEFISALFRAPPFGPARHFTDNLFQSVQGGRLRLEFVTSAQFHRAYALRLRYHDKPDISLVDFTSTVVMQDLGIADVFTGDAHFLQVNLGFRLHPQSGTARWRRLGGPAVSSTSPATTPTSTACRG
jgi:predicted nucleic acid-binding protein